MKEYLKDLPPKEIVSRLLRGEEAENNMGFSLCSINGILCSSTSDGKTVIGACIGVSDFENLYFSYPDKLKIEAGKFYRTRSGDKAICLFINESETNYPCRMAIIGKDIFLDVNKAGFEFDGSEEPNDIIEVWKKTSPQKDDEKE